MEIKPKFEFVTGTFNTDDCEMVCVPRWKYASVDLCIKSDNGNWNIPVGEIKLYDSEKFVDAQETFEDAKAFGKEIARRWNAVAKINAWLEENAHKYIADVDHNGIELTGLRTEDMIKDLNESL